jgi:heavy metal sensor kinase
MSSRSIRSPFRTLAFRLTLWYAGIFTLWSCIAFLLFYAFIAAVIWTRTDEELLAQSRRFAALLASEGVEGVTKTAVIEAQAAGVRKVFFRLLYPNGEAFSSSNMDYWKDIGVHRGAVAQLLAGDTHVFETIVIQGRQDEVRILYIRLSREIILQIGQTMEDYSRFFSAFKRIFAGTMAFLIVFAAAVGWFMAKRAVSGIEAVTRTARRISEGNIEERVPLKKRDDEIDQLAATFNEMLDRIGILLREMKEMSDNIAHDLKSSITRIRGTAEVTLTTGTSTEEFRDMAASTIEECDGLIDMINTMLLISRTEAGVDKPAVEQIDLTDLVRRACDLFGPSAEEKGIALDRNVADRIAVKGSTAMIQRMLSNLLDNALKYTPRGGTIDVSLSANTAGQAVITVTDTGTGIAAIDLPHVFERFYRSDQSRSDTGAGLGLSLARAIANAHGGSITAESTPRQGSIFTITLPLS